MLSNKLSFNDQRPLVFFAGKSCWSDWTWDALHVWKRGREGKWKYDVIKGGHIEETKKKKINDIIFFPLFVAFRVNVRAWFNDVRHFISIFVTSSTNHRIYVMVLFICILQWNCKKKIEHNEPKTWKYKGDEREEILPWFPCDWFPSPWWHQRDYP